MAADRSTLRLLSVSASERAGPISGALEAGLRLAGSGRGAIFRRVPGSAPVAIARSNLSPEEESACQTLARRVWQQAGRTSALPSRVGGSTLVAQPLALPDGPSADHVLVAVIRGGGGTIDTERFATLRDVGCLLASVIHAADLAEQADEAAAEKRGRAERVLALNQALQALADTDDPSAAYSNLLALLLPQFPGVDFGSVWLVESDGGRLRRVAGLGLPTGVDLPATLPLGAGYAVDAAVESGTTQFVQFDGRRGRGASARLARSLSLASALHVPLRSRTVVTGVLMLGARTHRAFSPEEQSFLETLGAQLGGQLDGLRQLDASAAAQERLRTLLDTLPVGIVLYDASGQVSLWNAAVETILGGRPSALGRERGAGQPFLCTPDGRPLAPDESPLLCAARDAASTVARELLLKHTQGGVGVPILLTTAPIRDPQGRRSGVIAVYQDITQIREVDRLKDDFINTVSHELRTPTTTVRGGAQILLKRGDQLDPADRREMLQDMADEAERLYHLVEDLLSLSRAQAGLRLQPEPIMLSRFVQPVILDLGGRVGNHALTVDVPDDLPMIEADPTYLEQVMRNLLENAVKFSPKGRRIELTAQARDGEVLVNVLDRGSGIPAADMDRVFEPFYRTEEAVKTGQQGAGLGLAVARRLIEIQGGRIWAERRPGGGTAFRFTLPAMSDQGE